MGGSEDLFPVDIVLGEVAGSGGAPPMPPTTTARRIRTGSGIALVGRGLPARVRWPGQRQSRAERQQDGRDDEVVNDVSLAFPKRIK
jgi:hypothetical protein